MWKDLEMECCSKRKRGKNLLLLNPAGQAAAVSDSYLFYDHKDTQLCAIYKTCLGTSGVNTPK